MKNSIQRYVVGRKTPHTPKTAKECSTMNMARLKRQQLAVFAQKYAKSNPRKSADDEESEPGKLIALDVSLGPCRSLHNYKSHKRSLVNRPEWR